MTVAGRTEGCSLGVGRGEGIRLTVYRLEARMPQGFGAAKILRSLYCVYGMIRVVSSLRIYTVRVESNFPPDFR